MRIGELGRRAGVGAKTIRYYEEIGLLPAPDRTSSGYRDYGGEAADRLKFIRDAQATGLSLNEIGSVLEARDHGEQTCAHVIELLEHHLADIDDQIAHLRSTRKMLKRMTDQARSLDPSDCVDPYRCQTISVEDAAKPLAKAVSRRLHGSPAARGGH